MNPSYPSKIDAWLPAVLVLGIGFGLFQCWWLHTRSPLGSSIAFGLLTAIVMALMVVSLPCRYVLEADHLLIQAGLIRKRIPYVEITGLELSTDPRSAPALSLRRVKVYCGKSFQLVSPRDREEFMRALQQRIDSARAQSATPNPPSA